MAIGSYEADPACRSLNNVMVYGANRKYTTPAPDNDNRYTTWRGGQYNTLGSDTRRVADSDSYPKEADKYPSMVFISDEMKLSDNVSLSAFPMGIPREDWGQGGYYPMMAIGLGKNSSLLNALKSDGRIASRTWSMFHGWMGSSSTSQADGTFVFGGYARAKVSGRGHTSLSDRSDCASQLLITIDNMIFNFPNGTSASLFPTDSHSMSACIIPDYPVLMTIASDPYLVKFQDLTQTELSDRSNGMSYYSLNYDDGDEPYRGDLSIDIQSGPSICVPNHQLVVPERKSDKDNGAWVANSSRSNLVLNPIQDINENDMPILGRQFLSSAYIMVNQNKGEFTICSSNPTKAVDLVAMDENGDETTDWCGPEETVTPTPTATSQPSETTGREPSEDHKGLEVGAIAGIAVGAVAGVILLGLIGFFLWRRRRRTAATPASTTEHTQPTYQGPEISAAPSDSEANRDSYLKHSYFKPELAGSMPRRPNRIDQHYELPAWLCIDHSLIYERPDDSLSSN